MIFEGSRYARTAVIPALDSRGEAVRALDLRRIPPTPGVLEHVVVEGERLDQLAQRFYGDPLKSSLILDANPEELDPFLLLRPGRRIKVPQNQVAP
jgi:nucleoid-associated protein YgaU